MTYSLNHDKDLNDEVRSKQTIEYLKDEVEAELHNAYYGVPIQIKITTLPPKREY